MTPTAKLIEQVMEDYWDFCKFSNSQPYQQDRHLWMLLNDTPFTQGIVKFAGRTAKEDLERGK